MVILKCTNSCVWCWCADKAFLPQPTASTSARTPTMTCAVPYSTTLPSPTRRCQPSWTASGTPASWSAARCCVLSFWFLLVCLLLLLVLQWCLLVSFFLMNPSYRFCLNNNNDNEIVQFINTFWMFICNCNFVFLCFCVHGLLVASFLYLLLCFSPPAAWCFVQAMCAVSGVRLWSLYCGVCMSGRL